MERYWLIIERLENWEADRANDFAFFGLPRRYRRAAAEVTQNDRVICYVSSKISAFSDIRVVRETGINPVKRTMQDAYDRSFEFFFSTSPTLILPRIAWVPLNPHSPDDALISATLTPIQI
jgi:hypothetical protein